MPPYQRSENRPHHYLLPRMHLRPHYSTIHHQQRDRGEKQDHQYFIGGADQASNPVGAENSCIQRVT